MATTLLRELIKIESLMPLSSSPSPKNIDEKCPLGGRAAERIIRVLVKGGGDHSRGRLTPEGKSIVLF